MIHKVLPEEEGMPLSAVVLRHAEGIPLWAVKAAFKSRDVRLNGRKLNDGETRVAIGDEIRAFFPQQAVRKKSEVPALPIAYEDDDILVIVKPQGLPCENDSDAASGDTAATRVAAMLASREKKETARLCHRLDVYTGGLLLFAKNDAAYDCAVQAFRDRTIEKKYTCLVKGCPQKEEETLRAYLRKDPIASRVSITDSPRPGASQIMTRYRVLEKGEISRLEVELITGRTHQIRAHLAHIGHPIVGDDKYGDHALNHELKILTQRLWATSMEFHIQEGVLAGLEGKQITTCCPF